MRNATVELVRRRSVSRWQAELTWSEATLMSGRSANLPGAAVARRRLPGSRSVLPLGRRSVSAWLFLTVMVSLIVGSDFVDSIFRLSGSSRVGAEELAPLRYPPTRRGEQVDDYHGRTIADPYRWLEDVSSPETLAWITAQNELTTSYLEKIPQRKQLEERLAELWNYEKYGLPVRRGDRYFYTFNTGLQNQSVLYLVEGLEGESRVLLDPNQWAEDGTVALAGWVPSEDGRYLAYGIAQGGSDWRQWKILEVSSGKLLEETLDWVKFSSVSWLPDGSGFYYSRYDEPKPGEELSGVNHYQKLYFHRLGSPQSADQLIYERPDQKEWGFGGYVTEDGRYLIMSVWRGTDPENQLFYQDLQSPAQPVVELLSGFDAEYSFIGNEGPIFWIATDQNAPRKRVIAIDLRQPQREQWREVIPEADSVLRGVGLVGDRFFASYLQHAATRVKVYQLNGTLEREVALPGIGTTDGFGGHRKDTETFYAFYNFTQAGTIYRYDIASGNSHLFRQPKLGFDSNQFVTEQVFFKSEDGTRVPMFITHRRDLKKNGQLPTILYGYGGFDIALTPDFSVANLVWLERGGVYAVANLRGGGEYGREWHEAGMLFKKQNVFDDFIGAAEWLIENDYTSSQKLAIRGGSNGGLLVGACMTQRPELFRAAVPAVGVMDMLRYHRFTIGWAWVGEYGSADDPAHFHNLIRYSPLHNLKPGVAYPATLVTTADRDDRVVPGHSFKFAAALQAAHGGEQPVLIRIETKAGHGAGTPTRKRIESAADLLAFLTKVLEVPDPQPGP